MSRNKSLFLICGILHALWASGAGREPLEIDVAHSTEQVDPAAFFFVTITVTASRPAIEFSLPPVSDLFEGFDLAGFFDRSHTLPESGRRFIQREIRLRPQPGATVYRMAPFAIEWRDTTFGSANGQGYQLAPAVRFARIPPRAGEPAPIGAPRRLPFYYERSRLFVWAGLALSTAAIVLIMWFKRQRRKVSRPPSARDLAHTELDHLLRRRLPEQGLMVDFYVELTMIVRRFIERHRQIRAPEQTTPEFLDAVRSDPRFCAAWKKAMRTFLESSDLVKYAARRPDPQTVDQAVIASRNLIDTVESGEPDNVAIG